MSALTGAVGTAAGNEGHQPARPAGPHCAAPARSTRRFLLDGPTGPNKQVTHMWEHTNAHRKAEHVAHEELLRELASATPACEVPLTLPGTFGKSLCDVCMIASIELEWHVHTTRKPGRERTALPVLRSESELVLHRAFECAPRARRGRELVTASQIPNLLQE